MEGFSLHKEKSTYEKKFTPVAYLPGTGYV
jgi:hypothetical protein